MTNLPIDVEFAQFFKGLQKGKPKCGTLLHLYFSIISRKPNNELGARGGYYRAIKYIEADPKWDHVNELDLEWRDDA